MSSNDHLTSVVKLTSTTSIHKIINRYDPLPSNKPNTTHNLDISLRIPPLDPSAQFSSQKLPSFKQFALELDSDNHFIKHRISPLPSLISHNSDILQSGNKDYRTTVLSPSIPYSPKHQLTQSKSSPVSVPPEFESSAPPSSPNPRSSVPLKNKLIMAPATSHPHPKRSPEPHNHVCQHCQKRFTRPSSLRTHTFIHTGEKPFLCPIPTCNRAFSVKSNLRRHGQVHAKRDLIQNK